jgi:hypothetical protein
MSDVSFVDHLAKREKAQENPKEQTCGGQRGSDHNSGSQDY